MGVWSFDSLLRAGEARMDAVAWAITDTAERKMSEKIDPVQAANDLAEEAHGNGNDWEAWCKPRLDAILAALAARHGGSAGVLPGVYLYAGGGVSDPHHSEYHGTGDYTTPRDAHHLVCVGGGGAHSGGGGFARNVPIRDVCPKCHQVIPKEGGPVHCGYGGGKECGLNWE